jgi:hypothetical protein
MEAYQAAMLIAAPMTDLAWDMLKPRLLAQRESAELFEYTREQNAAVLRLTVQSIPTEASSNNPAKGQDREYERRLQPLRIRLGEIADEYIYGLWHGGKALTWDNTPIFTANSLHHIWKSHINEQQSSQCQSRSADRQGEDSDKTNSLTLDNMKWVYDTKIRPLADKHRREHFLCACCPVANGAKWYSFESFMQHFGAKHTSSFSKGNVVVHWQTAEWPDEPPFHLSPVRGVKAGHSNTRLNERTYACTLPPGAYSNPLASDHMVLEPIRYTGTTDINQSNVVHGPSTERTASGSVLSDVVTELRRIDAGASIHEADDSAKKLTLVNDLSAMWSAVRGIQTDLECVLLRTVFYHTAKSFSDQYGHHPSLPLVTELLSSQVPLRSLRDLKGLACKICVATANPGDGGTTPYYGRIRNVKLFKLHSLLEHFAQAHRSVSPPDWMTNMVETPFDVGVEELRKAVGMDETKLALIAATLEGTCDPTALLAISANKSNANIRPVVVGTNGVLHRLKQKRGAQAKRKKSKPIDIAQTSRLPKLEFKQQATLLVSKGDHLEKHALDPSRFDTDIGRSVESKPAPIMRTDVMTETRKALSFSPAAMQLPYRSPSAASSPRSPLRQARSHTGLRPAPSTPLDIAAILASLNGHTNHAASDMPIRSPAPLDRQLSADRQETSERQLHPEYYGPIANTAQPAFHHAPQSQPDNSHASFSDGVAALRASLSTGPPGAQAKHTHATRSGNQFQPSPQHAATATPHWYEHERHYDQRIATEQAEPVQYIQLPAQRYARSDDYHHLSPQQITYVDENGRLIELIPIERAPVQQVQYSPATHGHEAYTQPVSGRLYVSNWTQSPAAYDTARFADSEYSDAHGTRRLAEDASESRFS